MSDKDLPVGVFAKILRTFGYTVEIRNGRIKVTKQGSKVGWQQHLHKGEKDTLRRDRVRAARRKIGLNPPQVTDDDFYSRA